MRLPITQFMITVGKFIKLFFTFKYLKFWIPFIIAILTISVSFTTSTIDSVKQGSFEPMITEIGGRITLADATLAEDAELITSGEGGILNNLSFFQKFIGDFFILYTLLFVFYKISNFVLGNTNAPMVIYGSTILLFSFFQITFSLLFFQTLTVPFYGVVKSIYIIIQYLIVV